MSANVISRGRKRWQDISLLSQGVPVFATENLTKRISQIGVYGFHSTNAPRIGNQGSWGDLDDTSRAQAPLLPSSCFNLKGEALVLLLFTSPWATCGVTSAPQAGGPLWCPQQPATHVISKLCHVSSSKESAEARVFSWALCRPTNEGRRNGYRVDLEQRLHSKLLSHRKNYGKTGNKKSGN